MPSLNQRGMRVLVWALYIGSLLGLAAIAFTPLGHIENGVRRWIKLPLLPPQQLSEFAKIALVGVMADFWSRASVTHRNAHWPWLATAANATQLVDSLNLLLMSNSMSTNMRTILINTLSDPSLADPGDRVRAAVRLIVTSPEYMVQR